MLLLYSRAWNGELVWDDHLLLEGRNAFISGNVSWSQAFVRPFEPFEVYYRPVTTLVMRALSAVSENPWPFHLTNLLCHIGTSAFVAWFARWCGVPPTFSWLAAALFAVHPALVEPVAWISGLGDILAAAFLGLAFFLFVRAGASPGWISRTWVLIAATIASALALFAKESAALPLLLLGPVLMLSSSQQKLAKPGRNRFDAHRLWWTPALLIAFVLGIYHLARNHALRIPLHRIVPSAAAGEGGITEPSLALILIEKYALTWIAPLRLNLAHDVAPTQGSEDVRVWIGLGFLAGFAILLLDARKTQQRIVVPALWSALAFTPPVFFVPSGTNLFAERYLYLPAVGLAVCTTGLIQVWCQRPPRVAPILLGFVIVLFAALAWPRTALWRHELALLEDALRKNPAAYPLVVNAGFEMRRSGRVEEALLLYEEAIARADATASDELREADRTALQRILFETGMLQLDRGDTGRAELAFRTAIDRGFADERTYASLSALLGSAGRCAEALEVLGPAMQRFPHAVSLRQNRIECLLQVGRTPDAIRELESWLRLDPGNESARTRLRRLESGARDEENSLRENPLRKTLREKP